MRISEQAFLTSTLREKPWGIKVARILAAAVGAVDPGRAVTRVLDRHGQTLHVAGRQYDLGAFFSIHILAIGKAAIPMASAAAAVFPEQLASAMVLSKQGPPERNSGNNGIFTFFPGGHPIPNEDSLASADQIISQLSDLTEKDLVIVLISGGGSALFTAPAAGISLEDIQQSNQAFLDRGLDIAEINTLRKHLSRVKGGHLAEILYPARTITLILSDVAGNAVDMVASGPTAPDPTTFQDAWKIIEKYRLEAILPKSVVDYVKRGLEGKIPENPKPGETIFNDQLIQVIASNNDAIQGGLIQARQEGFSGQRLEFCLEGEARLAGEKLAEQLLDLKNSQIILPACLITGGETTVTLTNTANPGVGGRNLELALSAVRPLAATDNIALITLATDGEDGITDAAGAVVTGETLGKAQSQGMDPDGFLSTHNAYPFFHSLDDLLLPGVTGTNTNDLCLLFVF